MSIPTAVRTKAVWRLMYQHENVRSSPVQKCQTAWSSPGRWTMRHSCPCHLVRSCHGWRPSGVGHGPSGKPNGAPVANVGDEAVRRVLDDAHGDTQPRAAPPLGRFVGRGDGPQAQHLAPHEHITRRPACLHGPRVRDGSARHRPTSGHGGATDAAAGHRPAGDREVDPGRGGGSHAEGTGAGLGLGDGRPDGVRRGPGGPPGDGPSRTPVGRVVDPVEPGGGPAVPGAVGRPRRLRHRARGRRHAPHGRGHGSAMRRRRHQLPRHGRPPVSRRGAGAWHPRMARARLGPRVGFRRPVGAAAGDLCLDAVDPLGDNVGALDVVLRAG